MAEAVHDYGAKIGVQLMVGTGRIASPDLLRAGRAVGPSPLPCYWEPSVMTRELTIEEIEQLVQAFEVSARVLSTAGIDIIELNCHDGFLIDEFMSTLWNKRRDKYGGDLDGRLRFLLEAIESVKRGAGADFPVIVRFPLTH